MILTRDNISRLMRYGVVGAGSNLFFYGLYLLVVWAGLNPIAASGVCYVLALSATYVLNRRWTFTSRSTHASDVPRYLAAYGLGLAATLLTVRLTVETFGPAVAQVIAVVVAAMIIYIGLHIARFGQPQ